MPRKLATFVSSVIAFALAYAAIAQTPAARDASPRASQSATKPSANGKSAAAKSAAASRARRETREAVAALREVAEAARSFDDLYESVRTQSDAADALWPFDEQTARAALRRAWEAVTAPGIGEKVRGLVPSENPSDGVGDELTAMRRIVIEAAAKHDRRLAEIFLREFERILASEQDGTRQPEQAADTDTPRRGERDLSVAGWQRLFIARRLVADGEFKRAAEVAAPLLAEGASPPLVDFILNLRAHDAREADALYMRLLERTRADAGADANDVLLLSSPVVSPGLRAFVSGGDLSLTQYARTFDSPFPAEVRRAFFNMAATTLLRPTAASRAGGSDATALYFAIGRLLPFFERDAPQYAPTLHARFAALAADLGEASREGLKSGMDTLSLSSKNPSDPLDSLLARLSSELPGAKDAAARDRLRLEVVMSAARRSLWDRARSVASEIEDAAIQRDARLVITTRQVMSISQAYGDDETDDTERAASFVRAADVPPEARAAGFAQASELAARRGKRARADELLAEAVAYAGQAEQGEQRVTALALVALSAMRADAARAWEILRALVREADETDDLPFEALTFSFTLSATNTSSETFLNAPGVQLSFSVPDRPVSLSDLFASAARLDSSRAMAEARSLKDEITRAGAMLAAARATLEKSSRGKVEGARQVLQRGGK
ncbi:MAG TPA: hypothetical protein VEX60_05100 [Pyrinomonadaceae bacterium]|nr:hypothetical protein [Pyrinomonadaceae bacterium]